MSGARPDPGPARGGARRLIPSDWPYALRAGIESVLAGWCLVVIPALAVFVTTSSMDAAAALSLGSAVRAGTALWALGFGGTWGLSESPDGVLGLPLLGVTCVQVLITRWSVRRAGLSGATAGAWTVGAAVLSAGVLVAAASPAASRTWPAVAGLGLLTGLVTLRCLHVSGRGPRALTRWWAERPGWLDAAASLARGVAAALALLVAVVAILAVVTGAGRVSRLHDALAGGGIVPALGLILLQLGWLPTMAVWALAWIAGPGFSVGTGSVFSPDMVVAGAVPSLPLLGLLPNAPLGAPGLYLPLVVTVSAMVVAWRRRRVLQRLTIGQALKAGVVASLLIAGGALLLGWAASGPVGPGRMSDVGPNVAYMTVLIAVEVGAGLVSVAALSHPYARELTGRGISATSGAADAAAHGTRERVEAGVGAARERIAHARRTRRDALGRDPVAEDPAAVGGPEDALDDAPADEPADDPADEPAQEAAGARRAAPSAPAAGSAGAATGAGGTENPFAGWRTRRAGAPGTTRKDDT